MERQQESLSVLLLILGSSGRQGEMADLACVKTQAQASIVDFVVAVAAVAAAKKNEYLKKIAPSLHIKSRLDSSILYTNCVRYFLRTQRF